MKTFIILLMLYTATCIAQDTSCGIVWHPPVKFLSPDTTSSSTPKIVTQGDTIHVVYENNFFGGARLSYIRSTNGGLDFEQVRNLITDTVKFSRPNINRIYPVTNGRLLYLFFIGGIDGTGESPIFMVVSTDRGDSWTEPRAITQRNAFKRSVTILDDTICILAQIDSLLWDRVIFSTDGGMNWSISSDSIVGGEPRIALSKNWLHLVYQTRAIEGYPLDIIYKRSSDFGMTWQDSTVLSTLDNRGGIEPAIIADAKGNVFVAWKEAKYGCYTGFSCSVVLRRSTDDGNTWLLEQVISDEPNGSEIQLAKRDSLIAVIWTAEVAAFTKNHPRVRFSSNLGNNWCPVYYLTPDFESGNGGIAIGKSGVHCAWVSYENNNYIIKYKSSKFLPVAVKELAFSPMKFSLNRAYPCPFNGSSRIEYELPQITHVVLRVCNVLGQEITTLVNKRQEPGKHSVIWTPDNQPSGIYFYHIITDGFVATGKTILIK